MLRRSKRTRAKIFGTKTRPRLSVFRSNLYVTLQLIDDEKGVTIMSLSTRHLPESKETKIKRAELLGEASAKKIFELGIDKIVFDRGQYKYHGRVRALAEGLRRGGLKF